MKLAAFFIAIIIHEFGHGLTGYICGDDGYDKKRRIFLINIPYDPFGTFIGPLLFYFTNLPIIGWAHTPHIHSERYYIPSTGPIRMIISGIGMNLAVSLILIFILKFNIITGNGTYYAKLLIEENLLIFFINLIPLLPFDMGLLWQYFSPAWRSILYKEFEFVVGIIVILIWYGLFGEVADFYMQKLLQMI